MDSSRVIRLARHGLYPVAVCDIAGLLRSEVPRRGAVRVCDGRRCRVALARCSRESLRRLQQGYNAKVLAELLNAKSREINSFLSGQLGPGRTNELHGEQLAAGIPLQLFALMWSSPDVIGLLSNNVVSFSRNL